MMKKFEVMTCLNYVVHDNENEKNFESSMIFPCKDKYKKAVYIEIPISDLESAWYQAGGNYDELSRALRNSFREIIECGHNYGLIGIIDSNSENSEFFKDYLDQLVKNMIRK